MNPAQGNSLFPAIVLACSFVAGAAAGEDLSGEQKSQLVFGESVSMGQVLVENLQNACPHTRGIAATAAPETRVLLLGDRKMTAFATEACIGVCDKLQINNSVVRCRQNGIKGCVIYGAIFGGRVHSFSIDPTGFNLEKDCAN